MKYSLLGFSQKKMIEINKDIEKFNIEMTDKNKKMQKLDLTDYALLRWFIDFKATEKMKKINFEDEKTDYYWVRYRAVSEEFQFFELNDPDSVYKRFKKLEKAKLLIHRAKKDKHGTFACYNLTQKVVELIYDKDTHTDEKADTHPDEIADGYGRNSGAYNPSTIDPSFKLSKDNYNAFPPETALNENQILPDDIKTNEPLPELNNPSQDTRRTQGSTNKTKEYPDLNYSEGFPLVNYWTGKPHLTAHKTNTKTYSEAAKKFCMLMAGNFGRYYTLDPDYAARNKISRRDTLRKWTVEEIKEAIDRYNDLLSGKFGIGSRDRLTENCNMFLFNDRTGSSIFLSKAGEGRELKSREEQPLDPEIVSKYRASFFRGKDLNATEAQELIQCVNFVIRREKEYRERVKDILNPSKIRENKFFDMHIKFLSDMYSDNGLFQINYIKWRWKNYIMWIKKEYGGDYDLNPSDKFLDEVRLRKQNDSAFDKELERAEEERNWVQSIFNKSHDSAMVEA